MNRTPLIPRNESLDVDVVVEILAFRQPINEKLAAEIGLKLLTGHMVAGMDSSGEITATTPYVDFEVQDGQKLLDTIKSFKSKSLSADLARNLGSLAARIETKILRDQEYDFSNPPAKFYEIIKVIGDLADEFKRLGLDSDGERLGAISYWSKRKCLKEYKIAVEARIYGHYEGPRDWDINHAPFEIEDKWSKACLALKKILANPHAGELFEKIKTDLLKAAEFALMVPEIIEMKPEMREESRRIIRYAADFVKGISPAKVE